MCAFLIPACIPHGGHNQIKWLVFFICGDRTYTHTRTHTLLLSTLYCLNFARSTQARNLHTLILSCRERNYTCGYNWLCDTRWVKSCDFFLKKNLVSRPDDSLCLFLKARSPLFAFYQFFMRQKWILLETETSSISSLFYLCAKAKANASSSASSTSGATAGSVKLPRTTQPWRWFL